jgi:hypothetical protein
MALADLVETGMNLSVSSEAISDPTRRGKKYDHYSDSCSPIDL